MTQGGHIGPEWVAQTKEIAARIDELDYFELLSVEPNASLDEIREQYRALQATYHPDRFFRDQDGELVQAVQTIAKRLAEAYVVLRDPRKREQYARDVSGAQREARLRFSSRAEKEVEESRRQQALPQNPKARSLYLNAKKAFDRGDRVSAARDLKLAEVFEPKNPSILELKGKLTAAE